MSKADQMADQIIQVRPQQSLAARDPMLDIQVSTAKAYPRDIKKSTQDMVAMATISDEIAEGCFYQLPRGNKKIPGKSVRLAEIAAACWENLRVETRVIETGQKMIVAQATAWDVEKNVAVRREVSRRITDREGRRYNDDMIVVTGNAAASIAFRNAVLTVIPQVVTNEAYKAAKSRVFGKGDSIAARRDKMFATYNALGVSESQVLNYVGRDDPKAITPDDMAELVGVYNAIKEGRDIEEYFPEETGGQESQTYQLKADKIADDLEEEGDMKTKAAKAQEEHRKTRKPPAQKPKRQPKTGQQVLVDDRTDGPTTKIDMGLIWRKASDAGISPVRFSHLKQMAGVEKNPTPSQVEKLRELITQELHISDAGLPETKNEDMPTSLVSLVREKADEIGHDTDTAVLDLIRGYGLGDFNALEGVPEDVLSNLLAYIRG